MSDNLKQSLSQLRLHYLCDNLDDFIARMTKARVPPLAMIEEICRLELEENRKRSTESRLRASHVNTRKWKSIDAFDWGWPKKIERPVIERLFELDFIDEPANVVLMGPSSVGKTTIARNLVHKAVLSGRGAMFVEAHDLLRDLEGIDSARALHNRLKYYARPSLLCIDEIGYLSFSNRAGDLLFQLISQRYEKASTMITTNVPFKDWGTIFPAASCISAMLERLLHRSEVIMIEGDSYRLKEAEAHKTKSKPTKKGQQKAEASNRIQESDIF